MKSTTHTSGFSLVISLVILALLSVLVISFLSTTTLDRMTSSAFSNKTKAELATDMAVNQAITLISNTIAQYPDSATVWEPLMPSSGTTPTTEGTVLYYTDGTPGDPNAQTYLLPLFSQGVDPTTGQLLTGASIHAKALTLSGDGWDDTNSVNLNRPRSNGDKAGWIGSPTTTGATPSATPRPFRAKWNEVKETTPPPGVSEPRVISRYAFWVEDESFKVNLNLLGTVKRGAEVSSPPRLATAAAKPDDDETVRDQRALTGQFYKDHPDRKSDWPAWRTPIQGMLRSAHAAPVYDASGVTFSPSSADSLAAKAQTIRDGFIGKRLLELPGFNQADASYNLGDENKFYATIFSGGLNLSRHGSQRLNLNGLGFDQTSQSIAGTEKGIKQIVETIRYHAPKFHQRFYRLTTSTAASNLNAESVAPEHQDMYLYKIAANIHDYIDQDSNPTIILDQGKVAPRTAPTSAMRDDGEVVWAQGKEGIYLQEAATRERIDNKTSRSKYKLDLDYYLEFWNMTTSDIYAVPVPGHPEYPSLGGNPFVRISNQQGWVDNVNGNPLTADNQPTGDPIQTPSRDMQIDIANGVTNQGLPMPSGVVFKAGQCTLITTDSSYASVVQVAGGGSPNFSGGINVANTYYCSILTKGKREYTGPCPVKTIPGPPSKTVSGVRPDFREGGEDYDTEVILGNDFGYIDSHPWAISMGGSPIETDNEIDDHWYGGSLLGNGTTVSQLGDPRTNNEQITFVPFASGASTGQPDQTRYFNTTNLPRFSLGYPNDLYVNPQNPNKWPDYYKGWPVPTANGGKGNGQAPNPTGAAAPQYISNSGSLTSIGQLGDIFDPARVRGTVGVSDVARSRGGGRTLKIGQKDDLVDMSSMTAASQQWASWRLTDIMGTTSDVQLPGLININGLRRDNGAALRAACYGLTFNSVSWATIPVNATIASNPNQDFKSADSDTVGLQKIITDAITRLSQTVPTGNTTPVPPTYFRERGEFSDLASYTGSTAAGDLIANVKGSDMFDHSREELFRRIAEMITTRGNVFSVYAIGQTIAQANDAAKTKRVTGQHAVKVTFALIPKKADGTNFQFTAESFDPTSTSAVKDRFAKPDHYDVLYLQTVAQ